MDTRKITLIATIAVIALVAVGIGYAYTASTQNSGNNASSEYVTLTQSGDGAYQFADEARVYYDSIDSSATTITFKLADSVDIATIPGKSVVKIGKTITVDTTGVNDAEDNGSYTPLNGVFVTNNFTVDNDFVFFIVTKVGTADPVVHTLTAADTWDTNVFTITHHNANPEAEPPITAGYDSMTVDVYYGYTGTGGVVYDKTSEHKSPNTTPLNDAKITFSVSRAEHNNQNMAVTFSFNSPVIYTGSAINLPAVTKLDDDSSPAGKYSIVIVDANGDAIADVPGTTEVNESSQFLDIGKYYVKVTRTSDSKTQIFEFNVCKTVSSLTIASIGSVAKGTNVSDLNPSVTDASALAKDTDFTVAVKNKSSGEYVTGTLSASTDYILVISGIGNYIGQYEEEFTTTA